MQRRMQPKRGRLGRRELLLGGAAALAGCSARRGTSGSRPNILFAFADDQSWPHAGALGDRVVHTPAFDRVAREGVLFTHSFCAAPSCTPSRSAVLTGRHLWQVEEGGVLYGTLPPKYPLYTHLLEDAGYYTGYTGKGWGPGDWRAAGLSRSPTGKQYRERRMPAPIPEGINKLDYAGNFADFLDGRPAGAPFCFWFGSTEPHRIYQNGIGLQSGKKLEEVAVPPFWPDVEVVRGDILDYYCEIEWFDAHLASMIARLEKAGELDNTLIVVTSDNGMPFPRAKVNLYDWGLRMPLAIRWGSRISGGRIVDDLVSHVDFAPTFLGAAGIEAPREMAGRSLLPLLTSTNAGIVEPDRDQVHAALERHTLCRPHNATYPIRSIRTREFLYLRNFEPDRWPTGGPTFVSSNKTYHGDVDACPTKSFMVDEANQRRYPREYDLCFGKRPSEELYAVNSDPGQIHNLASDPGHREIKQQLRDRLEAYLKQTGDPRIEGRDPWQGYLYRQNTGSGRTPRRDVRGDRQRGNISFSSSGDGRRP